MPHESAATSLFRRHQRAEPLEAPDRPCPDRLTGEQAREVVGQGQSTLITFARLFLQAFEADRFQVTADGAVQLPRGAAGSRSRTCLRVSTGVAA